MGISVGGKNSVWQTMLWFNLVTWMEWFPLFKWTTAGKPMESVCVFVCKVFLFGQFPLKHWAFLPLSHILRALFSMKTVLVRLSLDCRHRLRSQYTFYGQHLREQYAAQNNCTVTTVAPITVHIRFFVYSLFRRCCLFLFCVALFISDSAISLSVCNHVKYIVLNSLYKSSPFVLRFDFILSARKTGN